MMKRTKPICATSQSLCSQERCRGLFERPEDDLFNRRGCARVPVVLSLRTGLSWVEAGGELESMRLGTTAYSIVRSRRPKNNAERLLLNSVDPKPFVLKRGANFGAAVTLQNDFLPIKRPATPQLAFQLPRQVCDHDRIRARQLGKAVDHHHDLAAAILGFPPQDQRRPRAFLGASANDQLGSDRIGFFQRRGSGR